MKILKVIHGYPPLYNAGSEVYSQTICRELAKKHNVEVFARFEDPFEQDFAMKYETDDLCPQIKVNLINLPLDRHRYRIVNESVDKKFENVLTKFKPDIVHIGHLNHLSASILQVIKNYNIPIVYTLHDYWLMCPRGQFIQRHSDDVKDIWALCDGQEDRKCAQNCYSGYYVGDTNSIETDVEFWTNWVSRRMDIFRNLLKHVDIFHAPSQFLRDKYVNDFGLDPLKTVYLDYGFDRKRCEGRVRNKDEPFTFGYIGTHIPAKGIQHLIQAFGMLTGNCQLKIWGRPRAQNTSALHHIVNTLPKEAQKNIIWLSEYRNENLITDVFNQTDCIVVPSIWYENSPLVIHEAQQARVPVITANVGGMSEYVKHDINGLLFNHRDPIDLSHKMQDFVNNPQKAVDLGARGYFYSDDRNIPSIESHIIELEKIYEQLTHAAADVI